MPCCGSNSPWSTQDRAPHLAHTHSPRPPPMASGSEPITLHSLLVGLGVVTATWPAAAQPLLWPVPWAPRAPPHARTWQPVPCFHTSLPSSPCSLTWVREPTLTGTRAGHPSAHLTCWSQPGGERLQIRKAGQGKQLGRSNRQALWPPPKSRASSFSCAAHPASSKGAAVDLEGWGPIYAAPQGSRTRGPSHPGQGQGNATEAAITVQYCLLRMAC